MAELPTVEQIRADLEAGEGPPAVRRARQLAPRCDVDVMLELSSAFMDHAIYAPLVDLWRKRLRRHTLDDRERASFANALNGLAREAIDERREDEAMALLSEAIDVAPRLDYIRRNLAAMLVHRGDFDGALVELDTLLTNSPSDPQANQLMGVARYQSGDPELAIEYLQGAFDAGSPDAGLWLLKAQCIGGRIDDAFATLQRLAAEFSDRAGVMLELEMSEPGSPLQRLRDDPRAREVLDGLMP